MNNITYIGMDVHTTNYTLCAFTMEGQKTFTETRINPDIKELVKYLETLNQRQEGKAEFVCGYEAGCLGYTLYHELSAKGWIQVRDSCSNHNALYGQRNQDRQTGCP